MVLHNTSTVHYGTFAYARRSYFMGRWYVRDYTRRYSAPAYVSPPHYSQLDKRVPRVGARGKMVTHS